MFDTGGHTATILKPVAGTGDLVQLGGGTLILAGDNTHVGDTYIDGGTLVLGNGGASGSLAADPGDMIFVGGTLAFNSSGTHTVGQDITDFFRAGKLWQLGSGTTILTGANDYSGGTRIDGGTLQIGDGGTTGTLGAGTVSMASGAALAFNRSDDITVSNLLTGGGALVQNGTGKLLLTGGNDYSGGTTISGGTLQIGDGTLAGGLGTGAVVNDSALVFDRGTLTTVDNAISGSGSVTFQGAAGTVLTGASTYTGLTSVSAGTLQIGNGGTTGALGSGTVSMASGAALAFNRGDDIAVSNLLTGGGALVKDGAGKLTLTGGNDYSGGTTITAGTLRLENRSAAGTGAITTTGSVIDYADGLDIGNAVIISSDTTQLNVSTGVATQLGVISETAGPRPLEKTGLGTLILTGTNTYTGLTSVSAGTLQIGNGGKTGTLSSGMVMNNGILSFKRSDGVTMAGGISGTGILRQDGSGTLALTAANTFTGGLTVNAGTVTLTGIGNIAAGPLTTNGIFDFSAMSGSGVTVTTLNGTGTVATGGKTLTILNGGAFSGTGTGTGAYILNGGTFSVNGSLGNGITLGSGATLGGRGTVGGVASGSGSIVAPGNSIGTLNVAGNVTFATGSTYQVEVDAAGASDRIAATGTATLSGGTVDVQAAAGTYGTSTTYTILTAAGGVNGQFTNATSSFIFLTPTLTYGANAVTLTLSQPIPVTPVTPVVPVVTFPDVARTENQRASAAALQTGGAGGGGLFLRVLNSTSVTDALTAFDMASGEIHATLLASQFESASVTRRVVLDRMRTVAGHEPGWSVWGSISGNWGGMDGDGNAASARRSGVSLTAGADTRLDDNWRGGFEGGYSSGKLNLAARNSAAAMQGGHVGAYAYGQYDTVRLRLGGSYGFGTADTQRAVTFTGFSDLVTASQDADTLNLFGEAGYVFDLGGASIEPFAGLSWTQVRAGAFRESGGSAALAGGSRTLSDGALTLGAQAMTTPFAFAGVSLAPTLRAGWQHGFSNDLAARGLSFLSTGQSFTVLGTPLDADRAVLDAGASISLGNSVTMFLGYSGMLSSHTREHGVRLAGEIRL